MQIIRIFFWGSLLPGHTVKKICCLVDHFGMSKPWIYNFLTVHCALHIGICNRNVLWYKLVIVFWLIYCLLSVHLYWYKNAKKNFFTPISMENNIIYMCNPASEHDIWYMIHDMIYILIICLEHYAHNFEAPKQYK